nr:PREDICTED: interleukin-27 receptor subunit alpha [Lepisosteus oculatus]
MEQNSATLLVLVCLLQHALAGEVLCLWERYFHLGHNVSGACQLQGSLLPPGCDSRALQLAADGQTLSPHSHTHNHIANFTVIRPPGPQLHLRCEITCPGLQPRPHCDITLLGGRTPRTPSTPQCVIPPGSTDMNCSWNWSPSALQELLHTNLTLHLYSSPRTLLNITVPDGSNSVVVPRTSFMSHVDVTVWVRAQNPLGSAESIEVAFNTGAIKKPAPPVLACFLEDNSDIFILWNCPPENCDQTCEVRFSVNNQSDWTEVTDDSVGQADFILNNSQPFTHHHFQVRCVTGSDVEKTPFSDWSRPCTVLSAEDVPDGELDLWCDRDPILAVVWKEMPAPLARGRVRQYEVGVGWADGGSAWVNVSTDDPPAVEGAGCLECHSSEAGGPPSCRLALPCLWKAVWAEAEVAEVNVSAINSVGRSRLARLAVRRRGLPPEWVNVTAAGSQGALRVAWAPPPCGSEHLQGYVVQRKEAGRNTSRGFDWTRVNGTQQSTVLAGPFSPHTPYIVSVFAVYSSGTSQPASCIGYTKEDKPPAVPGVKVTLSPKVLLSWKHIPLTDRRGLILQYRVGHDNVTDYTVGPENCSQELQDLKPGQRYQFWVRAETGAGEGPKSIVDFTTKDKTGAPAETSWCRRGAVRRYLTRRTAACT